MTMLAKRDAPARRFATAIDDYSLDEVCRQVDVVLETGDAEVAKLLAARIVKAIKSGEWSFDAGKLAAVVDLGGNLAKGAPETPEARDVLRKAVAGVRPKAGLPAPLQDRLAKAIGDIERADTPAAKDRAVVAGQTVLGDVNAYQEHRAALGRPLRMGGEPR